MAYVSFEVVTRLDTNQPRARAIGIVPGVFRVDPPVLVRQIGPVQLQRALAPDKSNSSVQETEGIRRLRKIGRREAGTVYVVDLVTVHVVEAYVAGQCRRPMERVIGSRGEGELRNIVHRITDVVGRISCIHG